MARPATRQLLRPRTGVIIRVSAMTADTSLVPWLGGLLMCIPNLS